MHKTCQVNTMVNYRHVLAKNCVLPRANQVNPSTCFSSLNNKHCRLLSQSPAWMGALYPELVSGNPAHFFNKGQSFCQTVNLHVEMSELLCLLQGNYSRLNKGNARSIVSALQSTTFRLSLERKLVNEYKWRWNRMG